MALNTRQRRLLPSGSPSEPDTYTKLDKHSRSDGAEEHDNGLRWFLILLPLGIMRYMSATSNIIHDCDEVFNYWEPLHYLLYHSGFQTWEYSSDFALRSYLYILLHKIVGLPASWLFAEEKVRVFYAIRIFLALISVVADGTLVVALSRKYGKRLGSYALAMLCLTSGCFFASTSFLPSSFSMYAMSLSSGLFLLGKPALSVAVAAAGVILGWPFSILAFFPLVLFSLSRRFRQTFLIGAITSLALLLLSVGIDRQYYGRWTSSILNLLLYNVAGGGESHLYGTEGPMFYIRNGFNNFNFCFILALLYAGFFIISKRKYRKDLLIVVSPLYLWLMFMSLLPHKEERFLFPVYPLVCVAASAVIEGFPDLFHDKYNPHHNAIFVTVAKLLRPLFLGIILATSHSRTFSLIHGYSAPMEVYKILEHHDEMGIGHVLCVGSEWHRFPSSFFLPEYISEVRWIDDGFRGLLPFPFNTSFGGTSAAPPYFNNRNKASDEQFIHDLGACSFLVELQLNRSHPYRGNNLSAWEPIAALPYLDRELSPPMYRSFFIPYLWQHKNIFGMYKIFKRIQ